MIDGRKRVVIENVKPSIDNGRFPIKRVIGEKVVVTADIFSDGHDQVSALLLYKGPNNNEWNEVQMLFKGNDNWEGEFKVNEIGHYYYTIEGWVDHFKTWQGDLKKRVEAGQNVELQLLIGAKFLKEAALNSNEIDINHLSHFEKKMRSPENINESTQLALSNELSELMSKYPDRTLAARCELELPVVVERLKALFSTWYEFFPRSFSAEPGKHGTIKDSEKIIPRIAEMGFDVIYFPPIHPIGKINRKGKNNSVICTPDDVGSPWAIGSEEGGHKAMHPKLGSLDDIKSFIAKAKEYDIEVALDLAFQCAPDHPYVKEHSDWFRWRPDGTVQHAENPPKKYEDILPINFETKNWRELWEELKSIVLFWAENGIKIFRVDNPHTKPFKFWEWLIIECKKIDPDIIFLSEAFTRPKVMYQLAKLGFTQSYTYFTWRNTKQELIEYITHLLNTEVKEFFRPNFWPNTPDILPEQLQYGGRSAFMMRLVLASTLSSNYGIYSPAYELCINEAIPGKEEYMNSEKYELKNWDLDQPGNLKDFIARVNRIRKENEALQTTWNLKFHDTDNKNLLLYSKVNEDFSNIILIVVNIDPYHRQSGWINIPINELGIPSDQPYLVHDLLSDDKYIWQGDKNYVELDPKIMPAHIFKVRKRLKRETDFDYFM